MVRIKGDFYYDKIKSAEFIARIFGLKYECAWGHFAPVKVNDTLTLDFDDSGDPRSNHYAFLSSYEEFDAVLQRVKDEGISFGSGPRSRADGKINHSHGGRGFYFDCENGHVWEVIAHIYIAEEDGLVCRGERTAPDLLGRVGLPHSLCDCHINEDIGG